MKISLRKKKLKNETYLSFRFRNFWQYAAEWFDHLQEFNWNEFRSRENAN